MTLKPSAVRTTFTTDTATLALFDPAVLSEKADAPADWWADLSAVSELKRGQVAVIELGADGTYALEAREGDLTADERAYAVAEAGPLTLDVPSGQLVMGGGEALPGSGDSGTSPASETAVAVRVPAGKYAATVYRIDWAANPAWRDKRGQAKAKTPPDLVVLLAPAARLRKVAGVPALRGAASPHDAPGRAVSSPPQQAVAAVEESGEEGVEDAYEQAVKEAEDCLFAGDGAGALKATAKALRTKATNRDAYYVHELCARAHALQGHPEKAAAAYTRAIGLGSVSALAARGVLYANELGEPAKAIADLDKALPLLRGDLDREYAARGNAKLELEDDAGAVADFSEALKMDSGQADYWRTRGAARNNLGDFAGGVADASRAIKLEPKNPWAYYIRAWALIRQGKGKEAVADAKQAIKLEDDSPDFWSLLAHAYLVQDQHNDACKAAEKARGIDAKHVEALWAQAWALGTHPTPAKRDLKKALQLAMLACKESDWQDDEPMVVLAMLQTAAGDLAKARETAERAIAAAPEWAKKRHRDKFAAVLKG